MLVVDDFLDTIVDGTEPVVVTLRRSSNTEIEIANALRRTVTSKFANSGGVHVEGSDTIFHIPDKQLNPNSEGREIHSRDTITTTGGTVFIVNSSTLTTLATRWQLACSRKV